jgi:hypothetical protein
MSPRTAVLTSADSQPSLTWHDVIKGSIGLCFWTVSQLFPSLPGFQEPPETL